MTECLGLTNFYIMKLSSYTMKQPRIRRSRAGFTLVEMVLVLGIVALLVGVGIVKLTGVLEGGKKTRVKADLNTLTAALRSYEADNMFLPSTSVSEMISAVTAHTQKPL